MAALGVVFSNIHDYSVPELTRHRTMASIPFGGRYRLVDFILSNMINSGITKVGIITKNNYQSLMDHVGSGKDWDLARKNGGLILLPPFGASGSDELYNSRLQALKGIMTFLQRANEDYVVMTDCDSAANIDYADILSQHIKNKADVTLAYKKQKIKAGEAHPSLTLDKGGRVTKMLFSHREDKEVNRFLNVFILSRSFLINLIMDSSAVGLKHFTRDILAENVNSFKIYGYEFKGFFGHIDSLNSYYYNNMQLLDGSVRKDLFGVRSIYTKIRDSAPTKYGAGAQVSNSLISDGCIIEGEVSNSILFRGVKVGRGTVVKNSVLMQDTITGENTSLTAVITDKNVVIKDGRVLAGCEVMPFFIPKGTML